MKPIEKKDLAALCDQVQVIAKEVGAFIKKERKTFSNDKIEHKHFNNLVSYVDKNAEIKIIAALKAINAEIGFIAEENTENQDDSINHEYIWIIDPLDGTTNFMHQLPSYAVSIALARGQEILLGVVYEINADESFAATLGGGAFLNGEKISVSSTEKMSQALLSTGFPYYDFAIIDLYIPLLKYCMRNTRGIRRFGAAAVDLCYVACGRFDGFFEHSLHPWDVAAGALIIQEAGGMVCDFKGGTEYIYGREIAASNDNLKNDFLGLIKKYLVDPQ
ncbi:UNVERIFIED_CONTAM: hypothetical protein GTU68_037519 [Idotea baltica]|nr:hypothetical protein [Idotea baltica]